MTVGARWKPKQASIIGFGLKAQMDTEPRGETEHFAHRVPFFIAALSDGWPLMFALKSWSSIGKGRFAENGLCVHFRPKAVGLMNSQVFAIPSACDCAGVLIVCDDLVITHIIGKVSLRLLRGGSSVRGEPPPGQSNLLPDCI